MPRLKPQLTKFGGATVSFFYTGYRKTVTQFTLFAQPRQFKPQLTKFGGASVSFFTADTKNRDPVHTFCPTASVYFTLIAIGLVPEQPNH